MTFIIRDSEAGNTIETFNSAEEAQETLLQYEDEDKKDGIYVQGFYEIVEQ